MSGLLGAAYYDPPTAGSASVASLQAMTAVDTANLRTTFTAPSNGKVLVRLRGTTNGATSQSQTLLGVLDGSTVRGRAAPLASRLTTTSSGMMSQEASFIVTGLTSGTAYTWDYAVGVEVAVASCALKYGGPNDTSATNAFGAASLEVWSTEALLAGTHYDPSTVANMTVGTASVMTALDTSNLRLTFTAPTGGNVLVRQRGVVHATTAANGGAQLFGVLEGSTVRARQRPLIAQSNAGNSPATTDQNVILAKTIVTGLTPGNSYTWDAAMGVEAVAASGLLSWGGPNNSTTDDAYGGYSFEVWDAAGAAIGSQIMMIGQVI